MDQGSRHPDAEAAPRAGAAGVGSATAHAAAAPEDRPVEPQRDLEQLDESLSQMTNLLLAGDAADEFTVEGDFDAPLGRTGGDRPPPADVSAEIEEAQAAVDAAMAGIADALDAPMLDDDAKAAPPGEPMAGREAAAATEPGAGHGAPADEGDPDASEAMRAAAEDLERLAQSGHDAASEPAHALEDAAEATEKPRKAPGSEHPAEPEPDWLAEREGGSAGEGAVEPASGPSATHPVSGTVAPASRAPAPVAAGAAAPRVDAVAAPVPGPEPERAGAQGQFRGAGLAIGSAAGRVCAAALEPVAAWFQGGSRTLRHSIAWVALWTAFNAACVWGYILLFRSATPQREGAAATEIVGAPAEADSEVP